MGNKLMVSVALLFMILLRAHGLTVGVSANPDTICNGGFTQLEAYVDGGSLPYTYSWTSNPPGFTSGSPIPTASPTFTTWYILTVTDNASNVAKDSVLVTVFNVPEQPGYISGPTEICKDSIGYYTVIESAGAESYFWTVPPDAEIISGQSTSVVTIQYGAMPGNVSVVGVNNCGNSAPSEISITLFSPPPQPGVITGPSTLCKYTTANFSVGAVIGASLYLWTVPPDADILNGQGFRSVTVHWGETMGNISVAGQNFCGNGFPSSKEVAIEGLPAEAGIITGKEDPCKGQNGYTYSVAEITGATSYIWTLPEGATINGPQNEKQIVVDYALDAVSGNITIKGHSSCGDGTESSKEVILSECSGINENNRNPEVVVYPNPVHQVLTILFRSRVGQMELVISDSQGGQMLRRTLQNMQAGSISQIDVSKLGKGLYFIKMVSHNQVSVEKILVQ